MGEITMKIRKLRYIIPAFILIAIPVYILLAPIVEKHGLIERGNEIIERVDKYRINYNKLPDSLKDIGITETMEGPVYYDKKDSNSYIIWFGENLGDSYSYDSDIKEWK